MMIDGFKLALAFSTFGLIGAEATAQAQCAMSIATRHIDAAATPILASGSGEAALFFTADLDVNTDGAARSYHPDDPRGRTLALNNMGNAITRIIDADGRDVTCSPRRGACFTRFMDIFEAARDSGYAPTGAPRFETRHIIPWRLDPATGHEAPCRIESGPFAGYFVSQTALIADRDREICDPARYLDALSFNAIVLPRAAVWRAQGVATDRGDLAVVLDDATGAVAFALIGDTGPADKIGEGSVALAEALAGTPLAADATFQHVKRLRRERVHTLIFPKRDVPRLTGNSFTQSDIDRMGAEALAAFGGLDRLKACASQP